MSASAGARPPAVIHRLREHEAAIERSLAELGWHLRAIRDERLYLGTHSTFEDYCRERWNYGRNYVNKQIAAAATIDAIEATGTNVPTPSEGAVRPLTVLPLEERADAWAEAVDEYGDNPTGAEVASIIERRRQPIRPGVNHPATFSRTLIVRMLELPALRGVRRLLDPFAGTGLVHEIADQLDADSVGIEIEHEWAAMHERTICADARTISRKMVGVFDAVVTSPAYGNRMADHHEARDDSDRPTYRHRLGRPLTDGNGGGLQWGSEYRLLHSAVWARIVDLMPAGGVFVLNIKDHVRDGERMPVSAWHVATLLEFGLGFDDDASIPARGLGGSAGENADVRTGVEHIYVLRKP